MLARRPRIGEWVAITSVLTGRIYLKEGLILSDRGVAYIQASGGSATLDANCEPVYAVGDPVSFRTAYYYKTGAVNFTYKNCETKSEYDIGTGINDTYILCDGSGAFNPGITK